jgi:hypothetical protein
MKQLSILLFAIVLYTGCQDSKQDNNQSNAWANAKWIAYEQLDDSMKVVPGVHGSGDELGKKLHQTFCCSHVSKRICGC